ncbi:MAG TPA: DinB family protein [Candidatus Limnocylindrales bacterium]|nr:DinB family protein [Candidatus Limnocylindrales bacterium]
MGARAEQLATKFEQSCRDLTTAVEGLSDTDWKKVTAAEKWPVAVVAHHVAGGHAGISGLIERVAKSQPMPGLTMDMIHAGNAKHAQEFANVSKADTLALHKEDSGKAATMVRGLSDAELDRSAEVLGRSMTAAQAIESILINHVHEHLGSIEAATGK